MCLGISALQYHFIQVCAYSLFNPMRFCIPGALKTPQVSYLVIMPIHQHEHDKKEQVYLRSWLQGTRNKQKANEQQVRLLLRSPSSRLSTLSRDQTCPSSSSPASGEFSQHFSRTTKDRDCQHQGSVFSIIVIAVISVNIT